MCREGEGKTVLIWNEETVRYLRDASEWGDYYARLASWIRPHLHRTDHLCDAGCGLGYLSLELSNYVNLIDAIDESEFPLKVLREKAKKRGNIQIINDNIFSFTDDTIYDAMVFSFFGKMEDIAKIAKTRCRGTVFVLKRNYVNHRFSVGTCAAGSDSFANAVNWLRENDVPFVSDTLSLEMGQPLHSPADARRFFSIYDQSDGEITDSFLRSRLIETGRSDFPLYLPQERQVGCLRFQTADLS